MRVRFRRVCPGSVLPIGGYTKLNYWLDRMQLEVREYLASPPQVAVAG